MTDASSEMALDERRVSYEGQVRGREGAVQMANFAEQASASRARAGSSVTSSYLNAGSSLLGGASDTFDKYNKLKAG